MFKSSLCLTLRNLGVTGSTFILPAAASSSTYCMIDELFRKPHTPLAVLRFHTCFKIASSVYSISRFERKWDEQTQRFFHSKNTDVDETDLISVTFVLKDGSEIELKAPVGMSVLEVAHQNDIDIEGACESSLACSTCHVIVDEDMYDSLPEPSEREEDLLDLAPCLTLTSRLSCQIILTKELDGIRLILPPVTRNFYVDGHLPKPH